MFVTQKINVDKGEVLFGFVVYGDAVHVKMIAAHLKDAPPRFANLADILLQQVKEGEYVLPPSSHLYYDDFASLVHSAAFKINWNTVHKELYVLHIQQIDQNMQDEEAAIASSQARLIALKANKKEAEGRAQRGLLHEALSYLHSVIFRLL